MPDATFFVYSRFDANRLALPSSRWVLRQESISLLRKLPSFLWLKTRGMRLCQNDHLDLFWAGRTIHAGRRAASKTLITIHDFNHLLVPQTMQRSTRWSYRLWFDRDVRSADAVVVNSRGTSDRLQRFFGRVSDAVIQPGLASNFVPLTGFELVEAKVALASIGLIPPYLLAVSTREPRKNIEALVDAFVALRRQGDLPTHQLVLVGARGWQNAKLAAKIDAAASWGIVLPGYVPDALMPAVYALADMLVMPSLYEGFGMPVLEARSMGTPVVTTDVPELREAADNEAVLVEPTAASIAAGIGQVLLSAREGRATPLEEHRWIDSARLLAREMRRL